MQNIENRKRQTVEDALQIAEQIAEMSGDGKSFSMSPEDMETVARVILQTVLWSDDWRLLARPFARTFPRQCE